MHAGCSNFPTPLSIQTSDENQCYHDKTSLKIVITEGSKVFVDEVRIMMDISVYSMVNLR